MALSSNLSEWSQRLFINVEELPFLRIANWPVSIVSLNLVVSQLQVNLRGLLPAQHSAEELFLDGVNWQFIVLIEVDCPMESISLYVSRVQESIDLLVRFTIGKACLVFRVAIVKIKFNDRECLLVLIVKEFCLLGKVFKAKERLVSVLLGELIVEVSLTNVVKLPPLTVPYGAMVVLLTNVWLI